MIFLKPWLAVAWTLRWPLAIAAALLATYIGVRVMVSNAYQRGYADADVVCKSAIAVALDKDAAARAPITYYWGAQHELNQAPIRQFTQILLTEVPHYVSPAADAACVVPVGFVRLHDAAARGAGAVPDASAEPNDAASAVALSTVGGAVAGNYGLCLGIRQQLLDLQGWVAAQQGVAR